MNDCLFCKIIAGTIPSIKVYEDNHVYCFLDIHPTNEGHCLVVPKHHYQDMFDTPVDVLAHIMAAVKKIAPTIQHAVRADGVNVIMNNRKAAGQVIFHAHIHLVPRFLHDGLKHWPAKEMSSEQLKETANKIASELHKHA